MSRGGKEGRLRVPIEALSAGESALSKEASVYVARVHRLGAGATFTAFDPERAIEADARILTVSAGGRAVTIRVEAPRPASVRAPRPVTLVQALGKGEKMDAIVRDATELGATRIVPVVAERSVARPEETAPRLARWRRIAIEAARQSGRGDVPMIDTPQPLVDAVSSLSDREPARGLCACFVPGSKASFGDALRALDPRAAVTVVIGPEGGLSPAEISACEALGIASFGLGPLVLRTETVCAAVLGALLILAGEGGSS